MWSRGHAMKSRSAERFWARRYSPERLRRLILAGAFARREVLAYRDDGFGMRMGELLNAWRIAAGFGARFVFLWPTTGNDGIRPADAVFSDDFRAEHLRSDMDPADYREVGTWRPSDIRALHRGPTRGIWSISKRSLSPKKKFVLGTEGIELPPLMTMREAFDAIGFVPELREIRDRTAAMPEIDVAIHIRRGDIVAEDSWATFDGTYAHKAIPLALVDHIVELELRRGRRVAVFGNGVGPLKLASRHPDALSADDVLEVTEGRADLIDFRDFCLLTRAREVVSAGSAFAMVPTLIGGGRRSTIDDLLDLPTQDRLLLQQLREHESSPAEVVIAVAHMLRRQSPHLDPAREHEALTAAIAADRTNPILPLALAVRLLERDDTAGAVGTLRASLPGRAAARLMAASSGASGADVPLLAGRGGCFVNADQWSVLEESQVDDAWIDLVAGLRMLATGRHALGCERLVRAAVELEDPDVREALAALTGHGVHPGQR